ncbi:hypothetical protein P3J6_110230 [Pseudoalteromonas sp. 3J6]|uniref:hypothetical protein n=1 Tax=Pseudoalteromonas sp. 3J6 TaxID=649161 RepID=UPI00176CD9F6|nr:hypothetical protein [Pseudoalteromonas sp. 3J6]CAD2223718.1 hypothetical protein P3J6_110230 [Pseudoalteromonas sp. 3J6]
MHSPFLNYIAEYVLVHHTALMKNNEVERYLTLNIKARLYHQIAVIIPELELHP